MTLVLELNKYFRTLNFLMKFRMKLTSLEGVESLTATDFDILVTQSSCSEKLQTNARRCQQKRAQWTLTRRLPR